MAVTISPGAIVTPEQWDALFAQHGRYRPGTDPEPANVSKKPADDGYIPRDQKQPIYRYFLADGTVVDARTSPDGQGWEVVDYKPSPAFQQAQRQATGSTSQVPATAVPRVEGTPRPDGTFDNDAPIMVWRTPDGAQVDAKPLTAEQRTQWEKDRSGRQPAQPTTRQQAVPGYPGWVAQATKDAQGNEVEVYVDPEGKTHRSLPAKPEASAGPQAGKPYKNAQGQWVQPIADANGNVTGTRPVPADAVPQEDAKSGEKAGAPYKNAQGQWVQPISDANGRVIRTEPLAPGAVPAEKPAAPGPARLNPDTGDYEEITTDANGNRVVRTIPREGAPRPGTTTRAPSAPRIVVGASQDALRQAYDEIQAEVDAGRRTPAWGENRRQEIYNTARLTIDEARLGLNDDQFNRSLAYNTANTVLQYGQGSLKNAMSWALSINDKIQPGSPAGANLFRATFMLQMQMMRDSGIQNVPGRGATSPILRNVEGGGAGASTQAQRRPPLVQDIDTPEKLKVTADQAAANIRAGLEASGDPRVMTPDRGGPALPLPARDGRPVTSTPAGAAPQISATPTSPTAGAAASPAAPAAPTPPAAVPAPAPPAAAAGVPQHAATGATPETHVWIRDKQDGRRIQVPRADVPRWLSPVAPGVPVNYELEGQAMTAPDRVQMEPAQMAASAAWRPPVQLDPARYGHTAENPLLPAAPQFAALEQFRMPEAPPPPPINPSAGQEMPNAVSLAQIQATPPWRFDPAALDDLVNRFGDEAVFSTPMPRVGAA